MTLSRVSSWPFNAVFFFFFVMISFFIFQTKPVPGIHCFVIFSPFCEVERKEEMKGRRERGGTERDGGLKEEKKDKREARQEGRKRGRIERNDGMKEGRDRLE